MDDRSFNQFDDEAELSKDTQFQQQLSQEEELWHKLQEEDYENIRKHIQTSTSTY